MDNSVHISHDLGPHIGIFLGIYSVVLNVFSMSGFDAGVLQPLLHVSGICAGLCTTYLTLHTIYKSKNDKNETTG